MKFSTKEDIEAPIDQVFQMVADFEGLERSALRRGAEVRRVDKMTEKAPGLEWKAKFHFRGKDRDVDIKLVEYNPDTDLCAQGTTDGLDCIVKVELVALSRKRTRMSLDVDLEAKTLAARLLLQSLKLARNTINKKFKDRIAGYAKDIEDRFQRKV
ncbi:SRPBCC family protein [Mesobacterium pallidum]|uniref:SRPBCC family protein n=1 Tax=Mesobacterium pallidum TaxID=2872037 RepID=UPI001EE1DC23|nr:SRPBCC family protein [Mesobacterium pallidum]